MILPLLLIYYIATLSEDGVMENFGSGSRTGLSS